MWRCLAVSAAGACLLIVPLLACGNGDANLPPPSNVPITVFAAPSLRAPFDKLKAQLAAPLPGLDATFSYAGTETLTQQLIAGAIAEDFASEDKSHLDEVQSAGLVLESPKLFVHNRLEIAVARGNPKHIHGLADLSRPGLVVVLADPSVPAGKYAQQALAKAGVTVHPASLEPQMTGVLTKVALGDADAGIVYVSDVATSGQVDGVAIPDAQNVIADYWIAALKTARFPAAALEFVNYLTGPDAQAILKEAGFEGL